MKNRFFLAAILAVSLVCSAVFTYPSDSQLSDVSLKDVEALASNESNSGNYYELEVQTSTTENFVGYVTDERGDIVAVFHVCITTTEYCKLVMYSTDKDSCQDSEKEECKEEKR
jgi:hypothetical protein